MDVFVETLYLIQNQMKKKKEELKQNQDEVEIEAETEISHRVDAGTRKLIAKDVAAGLDREEILMKYELYSQRSVNKAIIAAKREEQNRNEKLKDEIRQYRNDGYSDKYIALLLEISEEDIYRLCGPVEKWEDTGLSKAQVERFIELYPKSRNDVELASQLGCPVTVIARCRRKLHQYGVKMVRSREKTFLEKTKFTEDEVFEYIQYVELGFSDSEIMEYMGKSKHELEKFRKTLVLYGIDLLKGRQVPKEQMEKFLYLLNQEKESQQVDEWVGQEEPVEEKKSSLPMEKRNLFMKLKSQGVPNFEIAKRLDVPNEEVMILLKECERLGIKF